MKGDCKLTEFASVNDTEEYVFEVTADTPTEDSADAQATARESLRVAIAGLQPTIFQRVEQYVSDLQQL